ncbi:ABC transporter ATP-binding protein [Thermithiobacillus plumbiphilus]|uniref:ATP-binding cassette domain-containing protein n=1 Tax=Thermithiobacillus plumbiphilus TaxID=1729899 RepID=A0ABU9DB12_9PROT
MSSSPVAVKVRGLWTCFGKRVIHQDLDLTVQRGEILGIVGGSGSGKTTFLRELLGLMQPARGEICILGEQLGSPGAGSQRCLGRRWGVLFQQGALFSAFTVFENVAFPLREIKALDETSIRDLVMLKLGLVGLQPSDACKMPSELSGGMIKRVALARALVMEAELLFLDEPTSGLDPVAANDFDQLIMDLKNALGLTVVMITHDLDSLATACDRVAVLADKHFLAVDTLDAVARVKHPFIREFFHGKRGDRVLNCLAHPHQQKDS